MERDYRTGKYTSRELATMHGCSHSQVTRRAKAGKWEKDLRGVIRQAASAAVIREEVAARQRLQHPAAALANEKARSVPPTADTVMVAAEIARDVILRHRNDLSRARGASMALLRELEAAAALPAHAELMAHILAGKGASPAEVEEARRAITKTLSIGQRIAAVKALADAVVKLQAAERVAFDLDAGDDKPKEGELQAQVAAFVAGIHESGAGRLPFQPREAK